MNPVHVGLYIILFVIVVGLAVTNPSRSPDHDLADAVPIRITRVVDGEARTAARVHTHQDSRGVTEQP